MKSESKPEANAEPNPYQKPKPEVEHADRAHAS
jgi:hypothetical protein